MSASVPFLLLGLTLVLAACSPAPAAPATDTADIQGTVEARVQATIAAAPTVAPTTVLSTSSASASTSEPTATPAPQVSPTPHSLGDTVKEIKTYTVLVWNTDGSGSGISLGDGKVLTAEHVVEGTGPVNLRFSDGRQDRARVLRTDARRDLALLQSAFHDTPAAQLRDARSLQALDNLIAVGFPRADVIGVQDTTVTRGSFSGRWQSPQGVWHIQTDTPVNPGSSGGPLADTDGEVVGVVRMQVRQSEGLNFAVAGDEVLAFLADQPDSSAAAQPSAGEVIRAELVDTSVGPPMVQPGQSLTLTYGIRNSGNPATLVLGASLRPASGGAWLSDPADDKTITLQSGTNTYARTFAVPAGLEPGIYEVAWGLLGTDMQTSYGLRVESAGVQVEAPRQISVGTVQTVREFYALIASQNYAAAWNLLSPKYQSSTTYSMWIAGYQNTRSVSLTNANAVDSNSVSVSVQATDLEGGRLVSKTFQGTWSLILIDGTWRLDVGSIRQTN